MAEIETTAVPKTAVEQAREAWSKIGTAVRSITPSALARGLLVVGAVGGILWLFWSTWPALLPFLIGGAIAYALLPFTNWLDRFMPRPFAVAVALLAALAIFGLVLYASVTILGRQAFFLYQNLPDQTTIDNLLVQADDALDSLPTPVRNTVIEVLSELSQNVQSNLDGSNGRLANFILNGLSNLLNTAGFILGFLAVPAWLLLVLKDQQAGAKALQRLLPASWLPDMMAIWRIFDRSFRAFVEGLLVLALFVTLFIYVGLLFLEAAGVLSITFKLAAATFAGLMQLIPTVGPLMVVVIILLTRLTFFSTGEVLALLALYLLVEQLLRLSAEPRVRKKVVAGVHPALLIMVIVALSEIGFLWVFLAAPITAVLRDLFLYVYGRFEAPPRPAGLLPGEQLPRQTRPRPPRRPSAATLQSQPHIPAAYRHGRALRQKSDKPEVL